MNFWMERACRDTIFERKRANNERRTLSYERFANRRLKSTLLQSTVRRQREDIIRPTRGARSLPRRFFFAAFKPGYDFRPLPVHVFMQISYAVYPPYTRAHIENFIYVEAFRRGEKWEEQKRLTELPKDQDWGTCEIDGSQLHDDPTRKCKHWFSNSPRKSGLWIVRARSCSWSSVLLPLGDDDNQRYRWTCLGEASHILFFSLKVPTIDFVHGVTKNKPSSKL